MRDWNGGCPFAQDASRAFSARSQGMSLSRIGPNDVPEGPRRFYKDFHNSLRTEDIDRAQPMLAHRSSGGGIGLPWKNIRLPEKPEVAVKKRLYPPVDSRRPRDMSLKTDDIDGAQSKSVGGNGEGFQRSEAAMVNPLVPWYRHFSSTAVPPEEPPHSGKCSLDISDVDGAAPLPIAPLGPRGDVCDPLRCEEEFRSRRHREANAAACRRALQRLGQADTSPRPEPEAMQPEVQRPDVQRRTRQVDPLDPTYRHALVDGPPATSLHCRWAEEKAADTRGLHVEVIGPIDGTTRRRRMLHPDEVPRSLNTADVPGARAVCRAGTLTHSIYGPPGRRPLQSQNLDTADILGAQADTVPRGFRPKVPPIAAGTLPALQNNATRGQFQSPVDTATAFATPVPASSFAPSSPMAASVADSQEMASSPRTARSELDHY